MAVLACMVLAANAQPKLVLNTYSGTNLDRYDGQEMTVTVSRYICHGWNTISLPFAMSAVEVNEAFGSDCRLERLIGVESDASAMTLNFQDCKSGGIEANIPYILYCTGETGLRTFTKTATILQRPSILSFIDQRTGITVTMGGAQKHMGSEGLYGVLVRDNAEAQFVNANEATTGFYATRCYVSLSTGNGMTLHTRHFGQNEITRISAIAGNDEIVDVYNLAGVRVAAGIRAAQVNELQSNVYVVKGRKVLVK